MHGQQDQLSAIEGGRVTQNKRRRRAPPHLPSNHSSSETSTSINTHGTADHRGSRRTGKLRNIMNLPIEIFALICEHVSPRDLRTLSLTTRRLRDLLMSRASRHIWRECLAQVPALPDCPLDLSEPQYARLLFTSECYGCGGRSVRVDYFARARYCTPCYETNILTLEEMVFRYPRMAGYISRFLSNETVTSIIFKWKTSCKLAQRHFHEPLIRQFLQDESFDRVRPEDDAWEALEKRWKEKRDMMSLTGLEMFRWTEMEANSRRETLRRIHELRRESIDRRLLELGWAEDDIPRNSPLYITIVRQPRLLTENAWERALHQLFPILHAQRKRNNLQRRTDSLRKFYATPLETTVNSQTSGFLKLCDFIEYPEFSKLPPVVGLLERDSDDITKDTWLAVVDKIWQAALGPMYLVIKDQPSLGTFYYPPSTFPETSPLDNQLRRLGWYS